MKITETGIEQALLDIKGKYYRMPVYEMLGGKCRDKIRMYTHIKPTAIKAGFSIEEMVDIAKKRAAEAYNVSVAPHNPFVPTSLAACLQTAAACPNFLIQEHPVTEDGSERCRAHPGNWTTPLLFFEDGSLADW